MHRPHIKLDVDFLRNSWIEECKVEPMNFNKVNERGMRMEKLISQVNHVKQIYHKTYNVSNLTTIQQLYMNYHNSRRLIEQILFQ